ncbi:BfmA/BtgA family mobilization protein [Aestuariivivens insulae]|uniref:BfmA/BtgA family mobilization protein n=1 Tax=Aestuariivivens insulae TaxID=1621988 RepID=UPI001F5A24D0|nr:BfmA/BtgA family mobilization protein [Aestuariivivens insulae]
MEDKYQKYQFSAINIKKEVAERFREFSKGVTGSHTETMEAMLDFFEIHQLSPMDSIDGSLSAIEIRIKRRINNVIAIIKSIEQSQTLPTAAMLQSLFEQQLEQGDDDHYLEEHLEFIEKKFENVERGEVEMEETSVPKIRYERQEENMEKLKADFSYVLGKVKKVNSPFGKGYLKLELTVDEVDKYKRTIKNS